MKNRVSSRRVCRRRCRSVVATSCSPSKVQCLFRAVWFPPTSCPFITETKPPDPDPTHTTSHHPSTPHLGKGRRPGRSSSSKSLLHAFWRLPSSALATPKILCRWPHAWSRPSTVSVRVAGRAAHHSVLRRALTVFASASFSRAPCHPPAQKGEPTFEHFFNPFQPVVSFW